MASQKRSISFDEAILAEAERRAAGGGYGRRARAAGALRRAAGDSSAIDACVACGARRRGAAVATSHPADMRRLLRPQATILAV